MESKPKRQTTPQEEGIELDPDAWDRFPGFIKGLTKAGPQHRPAKDREPSPKPREKRGGTKQG